MLVRYTGWVVALCLSAGAASATDDPLLDMIAQNVIKKYQASTCEQLWQQRGQPKNTETQEFLTLLKGNPSLRAKFINEVAAPVANKMFECGMVP